MELNLASLSKKQRDEIMALIRLRRNQGDSIRSMAAEYGMTERNLRMMLYLNGVRMPPRVRKPPKVKQPPKPRKPRRRPPESERNQKMLTMYLAGATYGDIGAAFGLSRQRAHYVLLRVLQKMGDPALLETYKNQSRTRRYHSYEKRKKWIARQQG